jgi:hypothetical protein
MESKIEYVIENVNDLQIFDRQTVARMIYKSNSKFKEIGTGLSINENQLSDELICEIYDFIKKKIDDQKN